MLSHVIIIALLVLFLIWFVSNYNKGIQFKNYVKEAFSTMDVYLKKRWDLIPNLIETTKAYTQYEKTTFEQITKLRNLNYNTMSENEKMDVNTKLSSGLAKIIAVAENYPELKANENFQKLMSELSSIEDEIAKSRKYYNGCAREFINYLELFPTNIIGMIFNFEKPKFYEIEDSQRENVKVEF